MSENSNRVCLREIGHVEHDLFGIGRETDGIRTTPYSAATHRQREGREGEGAMGRRSRRRRRRRREGAMRRKRRRRRRRKNMMRRKMKVRVHYRDNRCQLLPPCLDS